MNTDSVIHPSEKPPGSNNVIEPREAMSRAGGRISRDDSYTKANDIESRHVADIILTKESDEKSKVHRKMSKEKIVEKYDSIEDLPDFADMPFEKQFYSILTHSDKQPCNRCEGDLISDCQSCNGTGDKKCRVKQCDGGILYKDCSNCGGNRSDNCDICNFKGKEEFSVCQECSGNDYESGRIECGQCEGDGANNCECENGYQRRVEYEYIKFEPEIEITTTFDRYELDDKFKQCAIDDFSQEIYDNFPENSGIINVSNIEGDIFKWKTEKATMAGYELKIENENGKYKLVVSEDILSKKLISSSDFSSSSESGSTEDAKSSNSNADTFAFSTPNSLGSAIIQFFKYYFISGIAVLIISQILAYALAYFGVGSPLLYRILGNAWFILGILYGIFGVLKN